MTDENRPEEGQWAKPIDKLDVGDLPAEALNPQRTGPGAVGGDPGIRAAVAEDLPHPPRRRRRDPAGRGADVEGRSTRRSGPTTP